MAALLEAVPVCDKTNSRTSSSDLNEPTKRKENVSGGSRPKIIYKATRPALALRIAIPRRRYDWIASPMSANCRGVYFAPLSHNGRPELLRLAKEAGADLIVTGAYGHSRLGEWMFGGMTRGLLKDARCCLLMSH